MRKLFTLIAIGLMIGLSSNVSAQSYCNPSYRATCCMGFDNVRFGSINNNSGYGNGYANYTNLTAPVYTIGQTVNVTARTVRYQQYIVAWVDFNNDGDFTDAGELVYNSGSALNPGTYNFSFTIPGNAASATTRMRISAQYYFYAVNTNPCGPFYYGDTEDYPIEILGYQNSASIGELVSPGEILCSTANQVQVKISNDGTKALTSLEVGGYVNSLQFGQIPFTTQNWTGNIPPTQMDTNIYVPFNYSSGFQIGDELVIWTALPNGVTDTVSGNDTLRVLFKTGLSGSISVGDTTGGASDFATIADAINYMDSVGAVCDTFYVYLSDTITFNEQVTVYPLQGMSETAPVIFTTEPGASGMAKITHDHNGSGDNFTLQFGNGTHHYYFDNLNLESGAASYLYYNSVIATGSNSHDNVVMNCNITDRARYNTTSYWAALVTNRVGSAQQSNVHDYLFLNNTLEGGSMSTYFYQSGHHNRYEGNTMKDMYYMAMYNYYSDGPEIVGNTISSNSPYTNGYAVYMYYSSDAWEFSDNTIHPGIDEWPRYSLYAYESSGSAGDRNIFDNNRISIGQAWSSYNFWSVYLYRTGFTDVTNNSLALRSNSFDAYGLYFRDAGAIRVHNNNIASYGSGVPVYYLGNSTVISSNNNNIWTNGFILANYNGFGYTNLADWQNRAGYDANSVSVNPAYFEVGSAVNGLSDLHVCSSALDGMGDPAYSSMYDMDGDMRDANTPDIGADEFAGLASLSLGSDLMFCPGDSVTLEAPGNLTGNTVMWSNGSSDVSITVNMPGSYSVELSNNCGVGSDTIEIAYPDVVDLSSGDTLICNGDMITVTASLSNASYTWNNGENTQSIMIDDEGEYIVDVVDQYGCPSSDTVEVMISESARLNTSASDTVLCPGQFLSLESGVDPRTGVTYSWSGFNDGSSKTTNNVLIGWDEAANLVIEVNDNSCISYDTLMIDNAPAPVATFASNRIDGATFTFTPDSTHPRFQYLWDFGDRTTSTRENPTKLYQVQGNYTVVLKVTTLCGESNEQTEVETLAIGISEDLANQLIKVYPNPSSGLVNVQLEASENVNLEVSDMNGKVVYSNEIGTVYGTSTETLDLSDLAKGVYMIRVDINEASVIKKITIE